MRPQNNAARNYHIGPNMTPLVDVVMVILIFLMLAGSFSTAEHFMVSNLPARGTRRPTPIDPKAALQVVIDVNVYANGDVSILGTPGRLQGPAEVQIALQQRLTALVRDGRSPDDVQAILHPALATKWSALAALYDAALLADFRNVSFAQAR
jgi:biopolymer transport protein ExbD